MDFKDTGYVTIEKGAKKKVKCYKFHCKPINRELMIHEDIENKNHTSVSDSITGYRLFKLFEKPTQVKSDSIKENLKKFIIHFTKDGIAEEFRRIEELIVK